MKILMIIKKLHYSGAPKMFLWVAKSLASLGSDVTILTYKDYTFDEIPENVKVVRLNLESASFFKRVREIRKRIKEIQPDCSISFLLDSNILNVLACLGLKTKSVICERNDPFKPKYYKLKFARPLFRMANGAVFQLPKVAHFYKCIKAPTAVIPNPVMVSDDEIQIDEFEKRMNVVVTVGRIDTVQKRHDILIRAFCLFSKIHPEYILHIYGDGHDPKDEIRIRDLIHELSLDEKVCLMGVTPHPKTAIKNAKFFVLTSDFEGIPNSLLEAMSIGLPCISTDCRPGGAAYLIQNGINGLLAECGNEKQIAEQMCRLAENPNDAENMGLEARKIVETYSEKKIAVLWMNYLKDLCNVSN